MIKLTGIKKRLLKNYLTIILTVLFLVEGMFIFQIRDYYYNNIEQNLINRVTVVAGFYSKYINGSQYTFEKDVRQMAEDFSFKEYVELQIVGIDGSIMYSSTGFDTGYRVNAVDYIRAIEGKTSSWTGKNEKTGEKIMAASAPLKNRNGDILGVIRYVTSLEIADHMIKQWILISLMIIAIIIGFLFILSLTFSKSIINPIKEITKVSKKIAKGQFGERIKKQYNDEIGELADTINYMAGEIAKVQNLKNEFISSISHELRTPLTSIKGWGETILTGEFENKVETEQGIRIIVKEANRLTEMVEELLDFSKFESGRLVLQLDMIDIKKELEEVVYIFEAKAKKKGIKINYICNENITRILADRNRIKQVFINIIDNSIKFSKNEKTIFVRLYEDEEYIYTKIEDKGIGISKENMKKIGEKFYKVNSNKPGSGLGLVISSEIVQLHGGRLDVESELGVGTKVTIKLPKRSG